MIALIGSCFSSLLLFVLFRTFPKLGISTFQAIVFNYLTAFSCGFILFGHHWKRASMTHSNWMLLAITCAILFISLFLLMGKSAQSNGVATTSIASKMSMALSLLAMLIWYKETFSLVKIIGIFIAILSILLVSYQPKKDQSQLTSLWMLPVLFIGSGILDFLLSFSERNFSETIHPALFSACGFGLAGCIGSSILFFRILQGKEKVELKNILAGIALGIPNYFSIFLMLTAYRTSELNSSTVLALINISVVIGSALIGAIIYREAMNWQKWTGLAAAILSILLLYFSALN